MKIHLDALDSSDLKSTGWTCIPVENADHDFVSPLLNGYLKDLEARIVKNEHKDAGFAKNLRKGIMLEESEEMVNVQYQKIAYLKKQADEKE